MPADIATALVGLTGALIGSLGSAATTIYITHKQSRDHFNKEVWSARRMAYSKITVAIQRTWLSAAKLKVVLNTKGVAFLEIPDGSSFYRDLQAEIDNIRAALDESLVLLPIQLIESGEKFRIELIRLSRTTPNKSQTETEIMVTSLIQAIDHFRNDIISIARRELLGKKGMGHPPNADTSTAP